MSSTYRNVATCHSDRPSPSVWEPLAQSAFLRSGKDPQCAQSRKKNETSHSFFTSGSLERSRLRCVVAAGSAVAVAREEEKTPSKLSQ